MNDARRERLSAIVLVGGGGFVGAALRYGVDAAVGGILGTLVPIPLETLAVNVLGSFALGAVSTLLRTRRVRLLVMTGMLSSFTTYSTFAVQTASLGPLLGAVNVGTTYAFGFLAAATGLVVGRRYARRRRQRRRGRSRGGDRE